MGPGCAGAAVPGAPCPAEFPSPVIHYCSFTAPDDMNSENSARTPYRGWRGQRSLPGGDSSLGSGEGTQQGCYWGSWPHHSPSRSGTQNNPPASALLDSAVGVWGSQACPPHAKLPLARPSTPRGRWVEKAASQHPPAWPGPPHHKETAREFSRVPPPQGPAELQRTHPPCTEAVCAPGAAGARAAQELCRNVSPRRTVSPRRRGPRLAPRPGPVCTYPLATAGPCVGNHHAKAGGQWPPRHYPCPHPDCAALTVWGSCWGGPHARGGCTGHPRSRGHLGVAGAAGGAGGPRGCRALISSARAQEEFQELCWARRWLQFNALFPTPPRHHHPL